MKKREIKRSNQSSTQSALGCVKQMEGCAVPSGGVMGDRVAGLLLLLPLSAQGARCPRTGLEY